MNRGLTGEVLAFWFGEPDTPGYLEEREIWFKSTPEFDAEIDSRFGAAHARAAAGELDGMAADWRGALALVLILDQFPRNLFRGTAKAFQTDAKALAISKDAMARGLDRGLDPQLRKFLYMPFQHSEDLNDQERSLELFAGLGQPETLKFAEEHHQVIARFGRFPHRNKVLGRKSSPAEEAYLKDASGWGQK